MLLLSSLFLCSCSEEQIDRGQELRPVMETCDSKLTLDFPGGTATFKQVADYMGRWAENAGLDVTKKADHYIVLTNPATRGMKKEPSVTMSVALDPSDLRGDGPQVSLGMASLLGPLQHGRLRLIVTEATDNLYPGAEELNPKYLKCDHFINLCQGGSDAIYTAGPMISTGTLTCSARKTAPEYGNAFRISIHIPDGIDPYVFDKEHSLPNPVNVIGDLLASAKSSGRLFEIASFSAKANGSFLPTDAKAVVVIDDNNVEAFQKRFDQSYEAFEKRFGQLEAASEEEEKDAKAEEAAAEPAPTFTYTMEPVEVPSRVLKQGASNNIISLMYTLQTGIQLQDEASGDLTAASYIRSLSTKGGKFRLELDMRSRDQGSMDEMTGNYLITSGLCDVDYENTEPRRIWTCQEDSSLAAWFIASVNEDAEDIDTTCMVSSECDLFYAAKDDLDIISYHFKKDHRPEVLDNLLAYMTSLSTNN